MLYIKDWFLQKNLTDSQRQLFADGEKERKAFLRYGKGDTGFYFLKNFSNGYAAAGLPCQMMIERTAVEENHIRGREQRLPCKLSAQKR